jgi:hypothetical protein
MAHRSLVRRRVAGLAVGVASAAFAASAFAPSSSALIPPSGLVNAPAYCLAVYGDPSPCPPPERPEPDPTCLRVDIAPRDCPYRP